MQLPLCFDHPTPHMLDYALATAQRPADLWGYGPAAIPGMALCNWITVSEGRRLAEDIAARRRLREGYAHPPGRTAATPFSEWSRCVTKTA